MWIFQDAQGQLTHKSLVAFMVVQSSDPILAKTLCSQPPPQ